MKKIIFGSALLMAAACNQQAKEPATQPQLSPEKPAMSVVPETPGLEKLSENKFDPVCGMPVTAGISDTLSYEGHVLGFCSPDCKAEFAKKPSDFIKKDELFPGMPK